MQGWEKSIVTGVTATLEKLGYSQIMRQYFRSGDALWGGRSWLERGSSFYFGKYFPGISISARIKVDCCEFAEIENSAGRRQSGCGF